MSTRTIDFSDGFQSSADPTAGEVAATGVGAYADDSAFATAKGSAAAVGDIYFNTTVGFFRVHNGTQFDDYVNDNDNQTVSGDKTFDGTTTFVNDLEVTDNTITVNDGGSDATAEGAGILVERTGTSGAMTYEDALASKWKVGALGSEIEVVDVSSTQTLTNKSIAATQLTGQVAIAEGGTGAATATEGFDALAPTTTKGDVIASNGTDNLRLGVGLDTQVLTADSAEATGLKWATATGGSGGTGLNFVTNPDFEVDSTGWNTYADIADVKPVDGSGGSPTVTFSSVAGAALRGSRSGVLVKDAADRQGEGVNTVLDLELADLSSIMTISFDYTVLSGTFNFNGGVAGDESDIMIWLYDVTNSVLIAPLVQGLDGSGRFVSSFQVDAVSDSYNLIWHIATTNTSAWSFKFDNVSVSPAAVLVTDSTTDWVDEGAMTIDSTGTNPTKGTVVRDQLFSRRVGDSLELRYDYEQSAGGTAGSGTYLFKLPSGLAIDSTKVTFDSTDQCQGIVGSATGCATTNLAGVVKMYDTTSLALVVGNDALAPDFIDAGLAPLSLATSTYSFTATVPIAGWGSGRETAVAVDSNRPVVLRVSDDSAQVIDNNSDDTIIWNTTDIDSHGAYSSGTGEWTCPVNGDYRISATAHLGAEAWTFGQLFNLKLLKNGTEEVRIAYEIAHASNSFQMICRGTTILKLSAGDVLKIDAFQNSGSAGSLVGNVIFNYWDIEKIDTGSPLAALTEKVQAIYTGTGANTALADSAVEILDYDVKEIDTHNAVTTGASWVFTAPKTSVYLICAGQLLNPTTSSIGDTLYLSVHRNVTTIARFASDTSSATASRSYNAQGSVVVRMDAGDTLNVRGFQNMAASVGLNASAQFSYLMITEQ